MESLTEKRRPDIESIIGARWLNIGGIVAMIAAAGFFITYASERKWIGPEQRELIAIAAGIGMLLYSRELFRRGHVYFSEGIAAIGAGTLYLAMFAAWGIYHLVPSWVAATAMCGLTVVLIGTALRRDSQRLALLALGGGYATPYLVGGLDQTTTLFAYLLALNGALYWVSLRRGWRSLPLAGIMTIAYEFVWYFRSNDQPSFAIVLLMASALYAEFLAFQIASIFKSGRMALDVLGLAAINGGWFVLVVCALAHPIHGTAGMAVMLVLGLIQVIMACILPATPNIEPGVRAVAARPACAVLGMSLAAAALPIRLSDAGLAAAWAVEGLTFAGTGLAARMTLMRVGGISAFALSLLALEAAWPSGGHLFLNPRFETLGTLAICLAAVCWLAHRFQANLEPNELRFYHGVETMTNALAVFALSLEINDAFAPGGIAAAMSIGGISAQQLALTVLWTVYATVLVVSGLRRDAAYVRWQGLALYALAALKLTLLDLAAVDVGYRILSFLAIGVALLCASYLYQRRLGKAA
ncbi:MAG TPA: DUF2339 domain-containing protein [Candidatus Eremiobacteraceae bacterium]|nr:DUF2339 domain-containing protein [Candidatus Eremiobacteraceae bacterium]